MPDKTWKQNERDTAEIFGGKRTPLSGGSSYHTRGDIIHPDLFIECKYRKSIPKWLNVLMEEVRIKSNKEGKIGVGELKYKGQHGRFFIIEESDLINLAKKVQLKEKR